jgi:hypothetical protein
MPIGLVVLQFPSAICRLETRFCLTYLSWESGYSIFLGRERLCGDQSWKLNIMGSVPMRFLGLSRLGCGKAIRWGGGISLDLLDLMWVMGLKLGFGMMCGVGTKPRRQISQILVLLVVRKLRW